MFEVLGEILPYAVAIFISPVPIIAVILLLMSPKPTQSGLGFLVGWCVGILITTTAATLLAGVIPEPDASAGSQPVLAVIQLVLGLLMVLLSVKQWRSRPAHGADPELPAWMSKIDSMGLGAVAGLALLLAAVNPKNLLLAVAAGAVIGRAGFDTGQVAIIIVAFTIIAAITVLVPVIIALVAPAKVATVLASLRTWLATNNATIMSVVLLVLGAQVLGKAFGNF